MVTFQRVNREATNEERYHIFIFVVDDFCKSYAEALKKQGEEAHKSTRVPGVTASEIITIILMFQRANFRDFEHFCIWVREQYCSEFPKLPSYERFLVLQQRCLPIITALMYCIFSKNATPPYAYIDSTPIKVCHNKRIFNHKTFKNWAARGKSTMGWFYGFKLHLVVDLDGNILDAYLTPGNCDDREPVEKILKYFQGVICGDRGYISQNLFKKLWKKEIKYEKQVNATGRKNFT